MERATTTQWLRTRLGGLTWRLLGGADTAGLRPYLVRPGALLLAPAKPIKTASAESPCEVAQFTLRGVAVPPLVIKHYREPKLLGRLKDLARGPRAWRAARWAVVLQDLEVPAICPVAAGATWWRPWDSYLISRLIEPTRTFHQYMAAHPRSLERRPLFDALAQLLARLHDAGISHGDAHWGNFILHLKPAPSLVMVDLDGLRRFGRITPARAGRDLQRLLHWTPATPAEQMRFLVKYHRQRREPANLRELLAMVKIHYQRGV
jgi:tRNA A-37 threonylcarbamoyl transferase component Bud32